MEVLTTVLSLIVALSVLIAVHEFGHFWVARRLGVKVLRFSIGFGKPIWSMRRGADQTEYVLSAIPLGGYVKMLDEREGDVPEEQSHRAFNRQPVWKRFAIVAAGPLSNLGFAVVVLGLMLMAGIPGLKPVIGEVVPGTPAEAAGLRAHMEIVAVDGKTTVSWEQVFDELLPAVLRKEAVVLTAVADGGEESFHLPLDRLQGEEDLEDLPAAIGFMLYQPPVPPVIRDVLEGSAAAQVGLQPGDRILAVNGVAIEDWMEMARIVREHPGKPVTLQIERSGQEMAVNVRPDRVESEEEGVIGRLGAISEASPEAQALTVNVRYGPLQAFSRAVERVWTMSSLTVRTLGNMLLGRASMQNISGPITIAQYAKSTAEAGFGYFVRFLAAVSVSLGVLNLLPIPVLDGGHLMFYLIEMVKGSPISSKMEIAAQKVGIAILLMLMAVAFYNDLVRLAA